MRKRLPFYCYVLPLLLGAGAWWFVSWLTTPRPLWTRTFQTDDFEVKEPIEPVPENTEKVEQIEELGKRLRYTLDFTMVQDRLILRLDRPPGYQEHLDVNSGQTLSRSQFDKPIDDSQEQQSSAIALMFGKEVKVFDNHLVEASISMWIDFLPRPWVRVLDNKQLLPEWSTELNFWLRLRDRHSGQVLLTTNAKGDFAFFLTDRWYITIADEYLPGGRLYRVQAFAMPISYWSPWWGPSTGLIVALAFWFKRRQPLQA